MAMVDSGHKVNVLVWLVFYTKSTVEDFFTLSFDFPFQLPCEEDDSVPGPSHEGPPVLERELPTASGTSTSTQEHVGVETDSDVNIVTLKSFPDNAFYHKL